MNGAPLARYDATLQGLARKDRLRTLSPRAGLDFSSNDYLGLAASKRLGDAVATAIAQGTPVGATGSRLLRGPGRYGGWHLPFPCPDCADDVRSQSGWAARQRRATQQEMYREW